MIMKKNIILNVDDFGLTAGVDQAVFELNSAGVVNSTTALVNSPHFERDIKRALECPGLGVGIHLTIDLFTAEVYHPSLCDDQMLFHTGKTHDIIRGLDSEVIYNEWKAQIEKFIRVSGALPTHIDSHHHAHIINYDAGLAVQKLASEYRIPVRAFTASNYKSKCAEQFYDQGVSLSSLCSIIDDLLATDYNYLDVMMHPAIVDDELMACTSYNQKRGAEYAVLASSEFKDYLTTNQINVCNYKQIR